jgi:hypothetical protein
MIHSNFLCHIIIKTKKNQKTLSLEHSDELYKFIWGVLCLEKGFEKFKVGIVYTVISIEKKRCYPILLKIKESIIKPFHLKRNLKQ